SDGRAAVLRAGIDHAFFFSSRRRHTRSKRDWSSDVCSSDLICKPYPDRDLKELLEQAVENLEAEITDYEVEELVEEEDYSIPADPSVANFSYTVYDGKIYYRENSRMKPVELSVTAQNRVKGMIAIRDCTRELIAYQTEGDPDEEIEGQQKKLNHLYDLFQRKYGLLNSRA